MNFWAKDDFSLSSGSVKGIGSVFIFYFFLLGLL